MQRPPSSQLGAWSRVATPFGVFHVAAVDGAIVQTALPQTPTARFLEDLQLRFPSTLFQEDPSDPLLQDASRELSEYAGGKRRDFDLPLRFEGTEFQNRVWHALAEIPFGQTRSYQDIARAVGRPGASRAVGQANHDNPLAPIVPCHRVVTSAGQLGGYGGGMTLKKSLLEHEGVQLG
ncbi:MAG: methylated-DNA--[protein]-cysteine S-methyltransferase [bacterium]